MKKDGKLVAEKELGKYRKGIKVKGREKYECLREKGGQENSRKRN